MTTCVNCHEYFRQSPWNNSNLCYNCYDDLDELPPVVDPEDQVELDNLVNPTGHTKAVYYE
jgi:hypothetical protein